MCLCAGVLEVGALTLVVGAIASSKKKKKKQEDEKM